MDNDHDLIERCLRKEVQAQNYFYQKYSGLMYGLCLRYGRNTREAEDILQEGFLRVFNKMASFRFESSLYTWVRSIFIHTAINFMQKQLKFRVEVDLEEAHTHPDTPHDTGYKYSEEELLEVLRDLSPGYRTIFNLFVIDQFGHKEIGSFLKISEEASKSQLFRAKQKIRKVLEQKDKDKYLDNPMQ